MSVTFDTKYPAALTNAAWQKKKSFLDKAKAKTKTGLGEALTKAEATWGLIQWNTLQADKVPMPTPQEADKAKGRAETHKTTVVAAASKAALAAAGVAAKTKVNAGLSSAAKQAAATIEAGQLAQARRLRDIDLADFDLAKQHIITLTGATNFQTIKTGLVKADEFIETVEKDWKVLTFNAHIQDTCRRLTVALGKIGAYNGKVDPAPLSDPLKKWADGKELLKVVKDEDAKDEKERVEEALNKFKDAIGHIHHWAN
jgi:hypothetical protein